jgi:serine/threonine-protein kinase
MSMPSDPRVGTELAGFRIEGVLGRGGMGVVYVAEQLRYGRRVALKVLAPELTGDQQFRERFELEWRTAARMEHPNIIPIYEAGEAEGVLYIAMRYVEGIDLAALLARVGRLAPERMLTIVGQVGSALDAAHATGLIHRDVKPANVLMATMGEGSDGDHAYLADFGVAKQSQTRSGLTQTGVFIGTVDYAAPEQIEGKPVDGRADVYALGCVMFQCLAGSRPFEKESEVALISAHLFEKPPSLHALRTELPQQIDEVIAKALAKSPDDRYSSCRELVAAARASLTASPTGAVTAVETGQTVVDTPAPAPATAASASPFSTSPDTPAPAAAPPPVPGSPAAAPAAIQGKPPWWRSKLALAGVVAIAVAGIGVGVGVGLSGGESDTATNAEPPSESEPPPADPTEPDPPPAETDPPPPETDPSVIDPPAGGALAFASARDGDFDIYTMSLDGTGRVRLTNDPSADGGPRWSPDGQQIAFYSWRDGDDPDLYVMNADGSNVTQLTDDDVYEGRPNFSPDGSLLVFQGGEGADAEIWTVSLTGEAPTQITSNAAEDISPSWSPDGAQLAFARYDGNDYELWLAAADGSNELQLTDNTASDTDPAFSPDGASIVFSSNRQNENYDIWTMAADGSSPRRLATASREDAIPSFTPDGSQIVFDSDRDGDFEIFVMSASGGAQTQLTDDLTGDFEPDYSTAAAVPTGEPLPFLTTGGEFPTRAEALLLTHVPQRTRQSCIREERQNIARRAIAGVYCLRGEVGVFYDLFRTRQAMDGYYNRTVTGVAVLRGTGSCRTDEQSEGVWTLGEEESGRLVCYTSSSGTRVIVWTYDALLIVGWAQRTDGNRGALYRFWSGPHAGPVA